jgi:hypothetical protein
MDNWLIFQYHLDGVMEGRSMLCDLSYMLIEDRRANGVK